jgi:hypothetical protein
MEQKASTVDLLQRKPGTSFNVVLSWWLLPGGQCNRDWEILTGQTSGRRFTSLANAPSHWPLEQLPTMAPGVV